MRFESLKLTGFIPKKGFYDRKKLNITHMAHMCALWSAVWSPRELIVSPHGLPFTEN